MKKRFGCEVRSPPSKTETGDGEKTVIDVALTNQHISSDFSQSRLIDAARLILQEEGPGSAELHIAIVDDTEIHRVNREFLDHDCPTDVISFVLEDSDDHLEGEIIVSLDTATAMADRCGWSPEKELLLYVIHGTLHLVGYDDLDPESRRKMRAAEKHYLSALGVEPSAGDPLHGDAMHRDGADAEEDKPPASANPLRNRKGEL